MLAYWVILILSFFIIILCVIIIFKTTLNRVINGAGPHALAQAKLKQDLVTVNDELRDVSVERKNAQTDLANKNNLRTISKQKLQTALASGTKQAKSQTQNEYNTTLANVKLAEKTLDIANQVVKEKQNKVNVLNTQIANMDADVTTELIAEAKAEAEAKAKAEAYKLEELELLPDETPYFIPPATDPTYGSVATITTIEEEIPESGLVIMFEQDTTKIPAIIEEWNKKHPDQCLCVVDAPLINKEIYIYATSAAMNAKLPDKYKEMVKTNKENNKYNNIKKDIKVWSSNRNNITYLDTTKFI